MYGRAKRAEDISVLVHGVRHDISIASQLFVLVGDATTGRLTYDGRCGFRPAMNSRSVDWSGKACSREKELHFRNPGMMQSNGGMKVETS